MGEKKKHDNRSRKKGRIERLQNTNMKFKNLAFCTSSPHKKLHLSISAEFGEENLDARLS